MDSYVRRDVQTKRRSDKFAHVIIQRPDCGVREEGKMAARLLLRSTVRAATACRVAQAARAPALTRCMASGGEDETGAETMEPGKAVKSDLLSMICLRRAQAEDDRPLAG